MIRVHLLRHPDGGLCSVSAEGHALYDTAGKDIVCAAVTILLRTVVETLSRTEGIAVRMDAARRGRLDFRAEAKAPVNSPEALEVEGLLMYAGFFLETGISSLAAEFPACIEYTDSYITEE
jgi:uncharacterized protein YsxB (DUF464 family)